MMMDSFKKKKKEKKKRRKPVVDGIKKKINSKLYVE